MNAERYLEFLSNQLFAFINELPRHERQQIWYQHDGASCHSERNVREYLLQLFNGRVIGRYDEFAWPARSPDLTPLDFFLWGYLKEKVYRQRPFENVDHLERVIRETCDGVSSDIIKNVIKHFSNRTITCLERNGGYIEGLV